MIDHYTLNGVLNIAWYASYRAYELYQEHLHLTFTLFAPFGIPALRYSFGCFRPYNFRLWQWFCYTIVYCALLLGTREAVESVTLGSSLFDDVLMILRISLAVFWFSIWSDGVLGTTRNIWDSIVWTLASIAVVLLLDVVPAIVGYGRWMAALDQQDVAVDNQNANPPAISGPQPEGAIDHRDADAPTILGPQPMGAIDDQVSDPVAVQDPQPEAAVDNQNANALAIRGPQPDGAVNPQDANPLAQDNDNHNIDQNGNNAVQEPRTIIEKVVAFGQYAAVGALLAWFGQPGLGMFLVFYGFTHVAFAPAGSLLPVTFGAFDSLGALLSLLDPYKVGSMSFVLLIVTGIVWNYPISLSTWLPLASTLLNYQVISSLALLALFYQQGHLPLTSMFVIDWFMALIVDPVQWIYHRGPAVVNNILRGRYSRVVLSFLALAGLGGMVYTAFYLLHFNPYTVLGFSTGFRFTNVDLRQGLRIEGRPWFAGGDVDAANQFWQATKAYQVLSTPFETCKHLALYNTPILEMVQAYFQCRDDAVAVVGPPAEMKHMEVDFFVDEELVTEVVKVGQVCYNEDDIEVPCWYNPDDLPLYVY